MNIVNAISVAFGLITLTVNAASFDCSKAGTAIAKQICANEQLSKLDEQLSTIFQSLLAGLNDDDRKSAVKKDQLNWINKLTKCSDGACIESAYRTRMDEICHYPILIQHSDCVNPSVTPKTNLSSVDVDKSAITASSQQEKDSASATPTANSSLGTSDIGPSVTQSVTGTVEQLWRRTTEATPFAWGTIKDTSSKLWTDAKDKASEAWQSSQQYMADNPKATEARMWQETVPNLEEVLKLQEMQENLPDESWFGDNKIKNQEKINKILDLIVEILSVSNIPNYRQQVSDLHQRIAQAKENIIEFRENKDHAPDSSLVHKTVNDYARLIEEQESSIAKYNQQLVEIQRQYAQELKTIGIDLDDQTLELISKNIHVSGDLYVDLSIVFHQVNILLDKLEVRVNETKEELQHAKRYYGLYVIVLKTLYYAQEEVERRIQDQYIAGIDSIIDELNRMVEDTKNKIQQFPELTTQFSTLIDQQKFSIKIAQTYREELVYYRSEIAKARNDLNKDIALAWQTYKTVRVVGELSNIINHSQALLEKLGHLQVPKFRPFENIKIEQEYESITQRLRLREKM